MFYFRRNNSPTFVTDLTGLPRVGVEWLAFWGSGSNLYQDTDYSV